MRWTAMLMCVCVVVWDYEFRIESVIHISTGSREFRCQRVEEAQPEVLYEREEREQVGQSEVASSEASPAAAEAAELHQALEFGYRLRSFYPDAAPLMANTVAVCNGR